MRVSGPYMPFDCILPGRPSVQGPEELIYIETRQGKARGAGGILYLFKFFYRVLQLYLAAILVIRYARAQRIDESKRRMWSRS